MDVKHSQATNPTDVPFSAAMLQVIADAKDESTRRRHEYIGTEHLALALSRQTGDAAALPVLNVEPERVYSRVSEIIQSGTVAIAPDIDRPFTTRTIRAFSFAAESAHQFGHTHLGVSDLLVGLLREQRNIGAQVLIEHGITIERAYEYARRGDLEQRTQANDL